MPDAASHCVHCESESGTLRSPQQMVFLLSPVADATKVEVPIPD